MLRADRQRHPSSEQQPQRADEIVSTQGVATTYETINVHTPDRQSPSFLQVKEGEKVDVIGAALCSRGAVSPRIAAARRQDPTKKSKKAAGRPPPAPARAKATIGLGRDLRLAPPIPVSEPQPVPMDDWSLIRNAAGQSGWVPTRR
jgi:hypothetical protein